MFCTDDAIIGGGERFRPLGLLLSTSLYTLSFTGLANSALADGLAVFYILATPYYSHFYTSF